MDRLNQLRGDAGDSTLDTSSPPSEAYMSANESSSKYFSLSEVDSTFSISPSKDAPASSADSERNITEETGIITSLSPIPKADIDTFKIGKHIEAANILSGGVNIFDDNDNSYDGDELVIDDNVVLEDEKAELKLSEVTAVEKDVVEDTLTEGLDEGEAIPSKDTEVVLQIDGNNVDAIDIGNGLYLYRKSGEQELSAVQIIDDDQQQPSFKFLKVRENTEGNLEVYEEIQIEIPKELSPKDGGSSEKSHHMPIKDLNKVVNEPCNKVCEKITKASKLESNSNRILTSEPVESLSEPKSEVNLNGKMMKFNESRKSPLTFTPMTYHSTPNKEGIPLTKTMVDQQLHPSRHSDNIKKTIEVHTDNIKAKTHEASITTKEKTEEAETSIVEPEGNSQMTIIDQDRKETSTLNKDLTCILSDQVKEQNKEISVEIKHKECTGKNTEETIVIAEEKVSNKEMTQETDNVKNEGQEKSNEGETMSVTSELKESALISKGTIDNQNTIEQTLLKGHIDDKKPCKDENSESETDRNKDNEYTEIKHTENLTSMNIEDKQINLTNDDKLDKNLQSQSNKDAEALKADPIIEQSHTEQSKVYDMAKTSNTDIKSIGDAKANDITDQVVKTDKSDGAKSNIDSNDIKLNLNINKETENESDNSKKNLSKNEKVFSDINDLKVSTDTLKTSIASQIENIHCKDIKERVQDDPIKSKAKQSSLSLANKQKEIETQKISKVALESSKIPIKDISVTQTMPKQVEARKEVPKTKAIVKQNICNSAVPFGKWTEANRQEFLNKIKETKIPSNNSSTNQIKQTNDLNRRDVLKKFDSQRQSINTLPTKIPDFGSVPKFSSKIETTAFVNKSAAIQQPNPVVPVIPPLKSQSPTEKTKTVAITKEEPLNLEEQRQIINSQELIDKTVEGIITRALKMKTTTPIHMKEKMTIHTVENPKDAMPLPGSLDYIEMKMNELHGFSFTEKPIHELSQAANHNIKPCNKFEDINKTANIPNLLPFKATEQQKVEKDNTRDDTSDEEIIEHEPITGDIDVSKQNLISLLSCKEKFTEPKKDAIITEKDFDKFAGKNSITYENCLTVNFDGKEKHNVVQTVVEKETCVKKLSRNELLLAESKAKSSSKQNAAARQNNQTSKITTVKPMSEDDTYNKNYQSKVQIAYQSALTAKRNLECPISMIEDKPVKVVFMETNAEYTPTQLNLQGQELSPCKNQKSDSEVHSASESLDSDILDSSLDPKPLDERSKSKHLRKQVLTPVEQEPEIQLIEPSDLGIKVSPTKKRKVEERSDKQTKTLVPKKSYLLNRNVVDEHKSKADQPKIEAFTGHISTALDNLVKAAELIENQSDNKRAVVGTQDAETSQNTPVKRGRGRPRKYPLPEPGSDTSKPSSPQKKPRLIDAKPPKTYSDSDESSDGEIIKENWTMGKINENIVCPICSKLFRSEDVLFKHVKHCTGPSPNRSDSDKRSPRRLKEAERKRCDSRSDTEDNDTTNENDNEDENIKSRHKASKTGNITEDVIIENTPVKQKPSEEKINHPEVKKNVRKSKLLLNTNLVCEFCGKTFRQLSYLVNHKLQHKNEDQKKTKKSESETIKKSVFSCEVCTKEFRKLHHLVQHRIIHNPSSVASRSLRKTSSEAHEIKNSKTLNDDASAGFRCEPCDKSFRKLHHLVEHRETHDGINKKGNSSTSQATTETSKSVLAHHCDICKKIFKKLQDLLEHKEQHYETSSEKSDDKSVKSSLSTKDIIHECSLCYMVFPNEHSLNKHTVICLRKKRQSAAKQAAKQAENKESEETPGAENGKSEDDLSQNIQPLEDPHEDSIEITAANVKLDQEEQQKDKDREDVKEQLENTKHNLDEVPSNSVMPKKRYSNASNDKTKTDDIETPAKIKKVVQEHIIILDTPTPDAKKKVSKEKVGLTVTKKHKTDCPLPVNDEVKPMESSDEDEIRYMLNPNFREENVESKIFMKIRALKRNSLQIERPNSKDLVKRRISLQHPPKMPRLKAKLVESKPKQDQVRPKAKAEKMLTPIAELTIDSDDSDVKYSFPENETKNEKKVKRQSIAGKRKSLTSIAKRKSGGKIVSPKIKPKKRTLENEHRCDCGKLFSSAALLSRHTTLDHTPPRIRRRRSSPPPPPPPPPPDTKHTHAIASNTKHTLVKGANTKHTLVKDANTKTQVKDANTKQTHVKGANTKHALVKDGNTKHTSVKDGNTKHTSVKDGNTKLTHGKDTNTKHTQAKGANTKHIHVKEANAKQVHLKDTKPAKTTVARRVLRSRDAEESKV